MLGVGINVMAEAPEDRGLSLNRFVGCEDRVVVVTCKVVLDYHLGQSLQLLGVEVLMINTVVIIVLI